jgi:outer membrane protein W
MDDILNPYLCECFSDWDAEIRGAYFLPTSSTQRKIFTRDHLNAGVEISKYFYENWSLWGSFTYIRSRGNDLFGENTTLRLNPLSIGIKYTYPLTCRWAFYAGLGANYTWGRLWENGNPARHTSRSRVGFTTKLGLNYDIDGCFFVDLFTDYLYMPMQFRDMNNAGGFLFGLGIGVHL